MSTTPGEDWTHLLLRPQAIRTVYFQPPSFAVLHEIVLQRDGPRAELRLELDRFVDTPPKRWHSSFNRVQVVLRFDDLREIDVSRWGWQGMLSEHLIEKDGEHIRFRFLGPDVSIRGASLTVDVLRIDGYAAAD